MASGTLLPLWKFQHGFGPLPHAVTCISWNHAYPDLFAVGYGSFSFEKAVSGGLFKGAVACFTLKNPSWPENEVHLESSVCDISFHPKV
jgi:dynein intermediate chain 1